MVTGLSERDCRDETIGTDCGEMSDLYNLISIHIFLTECSSLSGMTHPSEITLFSPNLPQWGENYDLATRGLIAEDFYFFFKFAFSFYWVF